MSRRKRRSDTLAPALFPFLAVLLCTIGALIMVLAITVTSSHASAKKEAELALLEAKDQSNLIKAQSNELAFRREEMKRDIERRRQALQEIEDHIARLKEELVSLEDGLEKLNDENNSVEVSIEKKSKRTEELKKEIQEKKQEIEAEIAKKKDRRPAFAIMPYTGRSGTTRRPVYIECVKGKVVIQPEGIVIEDQDLLPPGPGNPLATALRVLRNAYTERDAQYGFTQPPYPLLIVRPDGIESYARARTAMSSWDDQFGYELVEADMELAFPPGVPGLDKSLADAVADAKQRQKALVLANPRLAREQELGMDSWDDPVTSNSSIRSGFGGDTKQVTKGQPTEGDWRMISPVVGYQGNAGGAPLGQDGRSGGTGFSNSELAMGNSATDGSNPSSSAGGLEGSSTGAGAEAGSSSDNAANGGVVGGLAAGGNTNASSQPATSGNTSGNNQSMGSISNQAGLTSGSSSGSGNDPTNGMPNDIRDQRGSDQSGSMQQSVSQKSGDESQAAGSAAPNSSKTKHVSSDGDLKPISVGAGKNWAQAKAEGKATPVTRTIKIIALKDKWLVVADSSKLEIEANILHQEKGPQVASEELAKAIRARVDAWGPSVPGGFWVPTVEIHQASDAQLSVGRMERLLEGSGVELKIVPLQLPRN
ncbi:MAG: hypothetical protein MUC83_03930 [Pirellula sp.]|jgi:hypothetical protein|nr:hypothetical protein [Pirellula sp.]